MKKDKLKILIIGTSPWDNSNSFGNTFSNLFEGIENLEIAYIYTKDGYCNIELVSKAFRITEKSIIKNLINKKNLSGKEIEIKKISNEFIPKYISFMKKNSNFLWSFLKDFIWNFKNWKSKELNTFLDDFKPDIIYYYFSRYCSDYDLANYVINYCNVPLIGHITDDFYNINKYQKDPLYYLYQIQRRKKITQIIKKCEFVDTFTDIQKNEYEKIFNIPFKIRYKYANIKNIEISKDYNNPLIFLYTGNLGQGRWKNLAKIGKILDIINKDQILAVLNIYSATPLIKEMENAFDSCKSLNFKGSVSGDEVQKLQSKADVLIHTESFSKNEIPKVRMSLSTKIIDYLAKGKCVLAFGPKEVASIDYFIKNDCGLVIENLDDLYEKINNIIENKNLISDYGQKALNCAVKNHNKDILHKRFYKDLHQVLK